MKKFTTTLCLFCFLLLVGCDREAYVEHKIKTEKLADGCQGLQSGFRLVSNFGGERYEFEKCLPEGWSESSIITSRQGDTVVVKFTGAGFGNRHAITLDIDSYPKYSFITIDGDTYVVGSSD